VGLAFLAACTAAPDCGNVHCIDAVVVHLPAGLDSVTSGELLVCLERDCKERTIDVGSGAARRLPAAFLLMEAGEEAKAVLTLPDGRTFTASGVLRPDRPNGPGCDPVCLHAQLVLA